MRSQNYNVSRRLIYLTSLPFSKPSDFACWTAIDAAEAVCSNPVFPVNGATNPIFMTSSHRTSATISDVIVTRDDKTLVCCRRRNEIIFLDDRLPDVHEKSYHEVDQYCHLSHLLIAAYSSNRPTDQHTSILSYVLKVF